MSVRADRDPMAAMAVACRSLGLAWPRELADVGGEAACPIDMWPASDADAAHARTREAVAAVLRRYEPSMVPTTELVDELIAAAETGV